MIGVNIKPDECLERAKSKVANNTNYKDPLFGGRESRTHPKVPSANFETRSDIKLLFKLSKLSN